METSDACQTISDASSRSDWFRQTVLFWSSQSTNYESCSPEPAGTECVSCEMTSTEEALSQHTSTTSHHTVSNTQPQENTNGGDYLLDLDHTTSELLKQVEEFEHCFSELTKKDAQLIRSEESGRCVRTEEGFTCTRETQSPHLTLEFPAGSSIRDSPLYVPGGEVGNKMECGAERTVDENIVRSRTNGETEFFESCLVTATDEKRPAGNQNNNNTEANGGSEVSEVENKMEEQGREDVKADDRGDPNDVLRDLLSGIKPPDGKSAIPGQFPTQSPTVLHEKIISKEKAVGKEKNIDCVNQLELDDDEIFGSRGVSDPSANDTLLQQIDTLIQLEHEASRTSECSRSKKKSSKHNQEKLERLDSGLNGGMSSDSNSNSPFPSPMVQQRTPPTSNDRIRHKSPGYDSGYVEKQIRKNAETIFESTKENRENRENRDWNFAGDDSDLSSDWSPLSTMDSADFSIASSSKRSRSYSVPHSTQLTANGNSRRRTSSQDNSINKKRTSHPTVTQSRFESTSAEVTYSESELSAIRKFLTLTRKYFDKSVTTNGSNNASLKELAMIPDINDMIEAQNKEVADQREMIEGFIRQLGDLLIEIVNLKDEQNNVRTKQAKALTLLKKQFDHHKKNQSQACTDILEQVNVLNEKLNTTLSTEQLNSTPVPLTKNGSVKSSSKSPSPSAKSLQNSKSNLTSTPPHSTSSLVSLSPRTNNYGHIIWKIPDVMRKITRIKSGVLDGTLVSSPFQTGEYQYNMNAWVYLNGRGKMVGKYVSVYACVLVGEYDAILPWPVTPTYKFTLIDQRSDPAKRQDHVRYRRVLDIAGRGENVISQNGGIPRPTDGSKALIVGLDDFIAHDQLLKNRYLVDDVIFLKVEAEIN